MAAAVARGAEVERVTGTPSLADLGRLRRVASAEARSEAAAVADRLESELEAL